MGHGTGEVIGKHRGVETARRPALHQIAIHMPAQARGSYDAVGTWLRMIPEDRRMILEQCNLIYTTKDEMWLVLKNEHTTNPYDWAVA